MARHVSEEQRRASALQAGRRMIARGERPGYRIRPRDGAWTIDALRWLSIDEKDRRPALEAIRAAVAEWLGVSPDAFDVASD